MSTDSCALNPPLVPRRPGPVTVLGIARISGDNQDQLSLEDQEALYRRWLDRHAPGGYTLDMIAGRGSGELLDRAEVDAAARAVESGRFDLVLCEDLGRAMRRVHAILFCELCEDTGTRLLAILDHIDTARPDWRVMAGFASMRHEMYNRDTAERIRRSLRHRFERGGVVQTFPYGYAKPPDAESDADVFRDPVAEPVYAEVFRRLEEGATYAEVADWLNAQGVPTGEWARNEEWDGRMVSRVVHNPILKGCGGGTSGPVGVCTQSRHLPQDQPLRSPQGRSAYHVGRCRLTPPQPLPQGERGYKRGCFCPSPLGGLGGRHLFREGVK